MAPQAITDTVEEQLPKPSTSTIPEEDSMNPKGMPLASGGDALASGMQPAADGMESVSRTGTKVQSTSDAASKNTETDDLQPGAGGSSNGADEMKTGAGKNAAGAKGRKPRSRVAGTGSAKSAYGTGDYKTVAARISGSLNAALEERCRVSGMTPSVALRTALEKWLEGSMVRSLVSEVGALADEMSATARAAAATVARGNETVKGQVIEEMAELKKMVTGLAEQLSRMRVVQVQVLDEAELDGALELALQSTSNLKEV